VCYDWFLTGGFMINTDEILTHIKEIKDLCLKLKTAYRIKRRFERGVYHSDNYMSDIYDWAILKGDKNISPMDRIDTYIAIKEIELKRYKMNFGNITKLASMSVSVFSVASSKPYEQNKAP
jgi:hypothetical protein